jgi:hypothetical protein
MIFRRHVESGCLAIFSHGASGYSVGVSLLQNEAGLPGIHRDAGSEVIASMLLAMAGIRDGDAIKRGRSHVDVCAFSARAMAHNVASWMRGSCLHTCLQVRRILPITFASNSLRENVPTRQQRCILRFHFLCLEPL